MNHPFADEIRPGDLVFFGRGSSNAKATEAGVDHVGIALSEHWMIHTSAQGVYVSSLDEDRRRERAPRALRTFDLFAVRQQTHCSLT